MAKEKVWLGMLALVLVFGIMFIGCDGEWEHATYDNSAYLYVTNTSSIRYYVGGGRYDDGRIRAANALDSGKTVCFPVRWNNGASGNITIYYSSELGSKNPQSRSYYNFSNQEQRKINIP
jgi:hypothetical protein